MQMSWARCRTTAGCEILGVEGEWTQIKSGSVEGYVKSEYLLTGDAALARADEVKQTLATVEDDNPLRQSSRTPTARLSQ